jgi:hypothetical protein
MKNPVMCVVTTCGFCGSSISLHDVVGYPCHYSMARPRVEDGRDGLQLWKLAANMVNKQPRTNDKG